MQCLGTWFTLWLFAISVNNSVASPLDISNVDYKNVGNLNTAGSNKDEAVISERDNEVGYLRRADEKGADAYQHFESFHDKDGDAYGYEKHEAYGKSNKGESLNDGKDKNEGSHYNYVQELGDKPKYQKYHGSSDDPGKGKQNSYHYSYNSDDDEDDDNKNQKHSSNYKAEAKEDDSSAEDEDDEEEDNGVDADNNETDEEKTTNFRYKIVSDDYVEDDGHGDINSKGNGNGYHFGHGDKNTDVDYNVKRSDYTAGDENDDDDNEEEDDDEGSEEEEDEKNVIVKNQKINDDEGKAKNSKSYSTYTTYSSEEGDNDEGEDKEKNAETDGSAIPKQAIRYEENYPIKDNRHYNKPKIVVDDTDEKNESSDDDGHVNEDVELHQPAKHQPQKPVNLVKEHRTDYIVHNDHPKSTVTKSQVIIQPSKPIVLVQEHHAGYKVEESDGGKGSDDNGKSNGGGGDSKGSDDDGDDAKGKSENLVLEKSQKLNHKADGNDNGAYKVNINYGKKKGLKKNGKKGCRKCKGSLKKKRIIKPHKYEVEEYSDSEEGTKQPAVAVKETLPPKHSGPIVAGKESSPQHHRDSDDYANGHQFEFASEADSDAYYW